MGSLDELYREIILDHFKSPHNMGRLPNPTLQGEGTNPLCGDSVTLTLRLEENKIKDIRFDGHGCAISQSSSSMMTDAVLGKSISEIKNLGKSFKSVFGIKDNPEEPVKPMNVEEMGDLAALEGVKKFPVRIKCAILPWNTLLEIIKGK